MEFVRFVRKNAKRTARAVTSMTEELLKFSKLKIEEASLSNSIEELYELLGETVYSLNKSGSVDTEVISKLVGDIDGLCVKLTAVKEKLSKGKEVGVRCKNCGAQNGRDFEFCARCGTSLGKTDDSCCEEDTIEIEVDLIKTDKENGDDFI